MEEEIKFQKIREYEKRVEMAAKLEFDIEQQENQAKYKKHLE